MYALHSSQQPNVGAIYQYIYFFQNKITSISKAVKIASQHTKKWEYPLSFNL